jgi:hypothetical protein
MVRSRYKGEFKMLRALVGWLGLIELGGAVILPRSLHSATPSVLRDEPARKERVQEKTGPLRSG